jgi:hypothetical protein
VSAGVVLIRLLLASGLLGTGQCDAAAPSPATAPDGLSVRWLSPPDAPESATVEVSGLSPAQLAELRHTQGNLNQKQWQELLTVHVEQGDLVTQLQLPPMAGVYQAGDSALTFKPAFPLAAGLRYRAALYPQHLPNAPKDGRAALTAVLSLPSRGTNSTTVVTQIYPSTDTVPQNLLKFYLHFSASMSRGHSYDYIHLYDASNRAVELPFLEIGEELWDPEYKRLTLFIDPGRIKRGVQPLEEIGPSLEEGRHYTLKVDAGWHDGQGNPLRAAFAKRFAVGPPDRTPPDPTRWKVAAPHAGTREALRVNFPDPMDHALALRMLRVVQLGKKPEQPIEGEVVLSEQERHWALTPTQSWRQGTYQLVVQSTIEDLAGNNVGKPFEVDVFEGVQRRLTNTSARVSFEIR